MSSQSKKHTTMRMKHGWVRIQTWTNAEWCHLKKEKTVKGRWQRKRTKNKTKKSFNAWCLHAGWHQNYALKFFSAPSHFTRCWTCLSVCWESNSLVVNAQNFFTFSPVREFPVEVHTAKLDVWGGDVHTFRRLKQTAVSCKRSNCNKNKSWKSTRLGFFEKTADNGSIRSIMSLDTSTQLWTFIWIVMSSTKNRSISTNWKKNSMIGVSTDNYRMTLIWVVQTLDEDGFLKSTSLTYPIFPDLLKEIHQFFLNRKYFDTGLFSSTMFELRFTNHCIFQETILNPFKIPFDVFFLKLFALIMLSLFLSLPKLMAMNSSLLNDIILNWAKVQCTMNGVSTGFTFFQESPANARNDALHPVKKAFIAI